MSERKTLYWINEYADECVPCDSTLEDWAEWLGTVDLEDSWGRTEPAKDGDTFTAMTATRTDYTVTLAGGEMSFDPPLPAQWDFLALCYFPGGGWSTDATAETLQGFQEIVEEASDADPDTGPVSALSYGPKAHLTFRRDGKRVWLEVGSIEQ